MFQKNFYLAMWLGILNLPLALYFGLAYAPAPGIVPGFVIAAFGAAVFGHFFLYFALSSLVLILPVFAARPQVRWIRFSYATAVLSLLHIIIAADAGVYEVYRFHINYAMLDLFFNTGGEVISFSAETWVAIYVQAIVCVVYSAVVLGLSMLLAYHGVKCRLFITLALLSYAVANLVHAYSSARQVLPVVELQSRIPLYSPLTMNSLLLRLGVITRDDLNATRAAPISSGLFDYPRKPLYYFENVREPYNVLVLTVATLRHDVFNGKNMPQTWKYAQDAWIFQNHYSSSNAARGGIFGLFYGIPPSYWEVALSSGIPAALITAGRDRNYDLGVFSSSSLIRSELNKTVFSGVENLRLRSKGGNAIERDLDAMKDFDSFLGGLDGSRKFLSFIYLDSVNSYDYPDGSPEPFQPVLGAVHQLELNNNTDPAPIFNRYRNAVYYADGNVRKVLDMLEKHGRADNTIVIITSDHGEEFNDNRDNYWGHDSNFTDAQVKVPLIIRWPGKGSGKVEEMTSAYDITATLLPHVFGVRNHASDYTVGQDLFNAIPRKYVLAGSDLENAIIESNRIVLIDRVGMLVFKNKRYQSARDRSRDAWLFEAIKDMSFYMTRDDAKARQRLTARAPEAAAPAPDAGAPAPDDGVPAPDAGAPAAAPAAADVAADAAAEAAGGAQMAAPEAAPAAEQEAVASEPAA